jgi:uncharacterized protein YyaL (SSP411 family)
MFLTPSGEPFWGGTYFPPEPKFGRPAFKDLLREMSSFYADQGEQVTKNIATIKDSMQRVFETNRTGNQLDPQTLDLAMMRVCQQYDVFHGGIQGSPKFPNVPTIELMWRAFMNTKLPQFLHAVDITLVHMSQGGIYDHLGGGFARYSTDEHWLVPHFEKMLYDNAQMIDILSMVWLTRRVPIYRSRVEETVGWVMREMTVEGGAFASSIDADSDGEEGKFYVWTEEQIDAALGKDSALFKQIYDVRPNGNWEGRSILHRTRANVQLTPVQEGKLNSLREKLFQEREKRAKPGRDDKVLTDWNGMMIYALAQASDAFNRADWQAAAVKAFWHIADTIGSGDKLVHSWRQGKVGAPAIADDYAQMARAAIALFEVTGHRPYLDRAIGWVKTLDAEFWRSDIGGYAMTPASGDGLMVRVRTVLDGATPSVNGVMMHVLARLSALTGVALYAERFSALSQVFAADARQQWQAAATYFNGFDLLLRGRNLVIVGNRNDPGVAAFREVLRNVSFPNKVVSVVPPGEDLHERHPARGKGQVDNRVTVYLCGATSCSPPITDPAQLDQTLKQLAAVVTNAQSQQQAS